MRTVKVVILHWTFVMLKAVLTDIFLVTKKKICLPCATGCKGCKASDISTCVGCNSGYYASVVEGKDTCVRCF